MASETKQGKQGSCPFTVDVKSESLFFLSFCARRNRALAMKSTPSALFRVLDLIFRWKFTDFSGGSVTEKASHSTAASLPATALLFMCNCFF